MRVNVMYNIDDAIQECREKFGEDKPYFSEAGTLTFAGCKALSRLRDEKLGIKAPPNFPFPRVEDLS
ncbi:hypothetical protein Mh1964_02380 [Mannheimia haemolytica]